MKEKQEKDGGPPIIGEEPVFVARAFLERELEPHFIVEVGVDNEIGHVAIGVVRDNFTLVRFIPGDYFLSIVRPGTFFRNYASHIRVMYESEKAIITTKNEHI